MGELAPSRPRRASEELVGSHPDQNRSKASARLDARTLGRLGVSQVLWLPF